MSLYVGLNTGLSAIRAGQAGIGTVSHNISNASTPGYTRQRVDLQASIPFDSPDGKLGTGVTVDGIRRLRDAFVDARVRTTAADFAHQDVRSQLLSRTEAVMGEPDSGITAELNKLWNAFDDLAIEPDGVATRRQVLNQLEAVTNRITGVATAWGQLRTDTSERLKGAVDEVNHLFTQVADINQRVAKDAERDVSNDLLDQRDLALDRIAELTGATLTRNSDRTVSVTLPGGGPVLVDGSTRLALAVDDSDPTAVTIRLDTDPDTDGVQGGAVVTGLPNGEIKALQDFVNVEMPEQQAKLDSFAVTLRDAINTTHAQGNGNTGVALLGGTNANTLSLTTNDPADLAPGRSPQPLDGTNAEDLAALGLDASVTGPMRELIVDLGAKVSGSERSARAAGDVAVAAQTARQSQHGVSIDEEMVDLVKYQRQLEAASRVLTAIDQALDTLVNRVGIVGR